MKRDARIGMAVVLVLGLSVTALIGRALYKRGGGTGEMEGEIADVSNNGSGEKPADALSLRPRVGALADLGGDAVTTNANAQTPLPPLNPALTAQGTAGELMREPDHESAPPAATSDMYYSYTVAANDNPWKISSKVYGDGKYTQKIVEANGGMDALKLKLKSGSIVKIPQLQDRHMLVNLPVYVEGKGGKNVHEVATEKSAHHAERVTASASTPVTDHAATPHVKSSYKIEKGDTLASIARKNYGNASSKTIALITTANHGLDNSSLKAGHEIVLPAMK